MQSIKDGLTQMILKEHSKAQKNKIVAWVLKDKKRFDALMVLFLAKEYRIVQRAAWALRTIAPTKPNWIKPYAGQILGAMENPVHDALLRNGFLILEGLALEEKHLGRLSELCFNYLQNVQTPTAIKRGALLNLVNICTKEPDLKEEVILILEDQIPHATIGFVGLAKKVKRKLQK